MEMKMIRLHRNRTLYKAFAALLVASSGVAAARAQETRSYVSIGPAYATSNAYKIEDVATDAGLVQLRAGHAFNPYLEAEAETSFAVLKGEFDGPDDGALTLNRSFAGFLVGTYPLNARLSLFARGGYHRTRILLRSDDFRQKRSFDNFAFGGGASYDWSRNGLRLDYTVMKANLNKNPIDQHVLSLAFVRRF